jgi:2-succinyl-6-hydroxy-2,4-cyclohexadiene-1-carboxylate synthase
MGGRIALHLALEQPELVERLVLISTTAGIEDAGERAQRRAADEQLAAEIERDGVEAFAARWAAGPLFAEQAPDVAALAREDRLRQRPEDLAVTLRGLGTGTMQPVWDRLGELTMPAVVLVGERDAKFRALGERLAAGLPRGELRVVDGAGHAVHLERPDAIAEALR